MLFQELISKKMESLVKIVLNQNDNKGIFSQILSLVLQYFLAIKIVIVSLEISDRFAADNITITDDVNQYLNQLSSIGLNKLSM